MLQYRVPEKNLYKHWVDDFYMVFTNNCLNPPDNRGAILKNKKLNKLYIRVIRF